MDFRQSLDHFHLVPSFDDCIAPYKGAARDLEQYPKLTDKQHFVAKLFGFRDWQSFQHHLKEIHDELALIDLNNSEWGYIFDVLNGTAITLHETVSNRLLVEIVDSDVYEGLGAKWFGIFSKVSEDEDTYTPSEPMRAFIHKIQALTPRQSQAVALKGLCFWRRTFLGNFEDSRHHL